MKRIVFVLIISSILAIVLAGCGSSGLTIHQRGYATVDIKVVQDYNTSGVIKPTCTISKDAMIEVTDFSNLSQGSSESQPLIELSSSSCTGWAYDDSSLKGKINPDY